jgi:18S rRNA (guanine1575-N7)-methyltransferase
MKNGFTGGLIVDYPNSRKAKKHYLFLMAGYSEEIQNDAKSAIATTKTLGDDKEAESSKISVFGTSSSSKKDYNHKRKGVNRRSIKDKDWIMNKKLR